MSKTTITIIATVLILLCVAGYIKQCSDTNVDEQVYSQTIAELLSSVEILQFDNNTLYIKVAALTEMNSELDKTIKELDNKIFSKTKEIIRLSKLVGTGIGTIDSVVQIDSNCVGLIVSFRDTTYFYTTFIRVEVSDNPEVYYEVDIAPFSLTTYLVRDENGIWKGYAVPQKEFKDFITLDSLIVEIEKDEFVEFYDDTDPFKLGVGFDIGSNFNSKETIYNIGISVLLQEKHSISLKMSVNSDWYFVGYDFFFF